MATLENAIILATQAHRGQVDKGGQPYILHPLRVMLQLETTPERIVALLHDVVEDTSITLETIRSEGYSPDVVESIDCLTRREDESYADFIQRIQHNPLARRVKIQDLLDNSNLQRIPNPTEADFRRIEKYREALAVLTSVEDSAGGATTP